MSRRFLRPLFSFWDPFISEPFLPKKAIPGGAKYNKMYNRTEERKYDPNETFDNFYKDQYEDLSKLRKEQKQFFQKHYPQRVGKKFNPYETLGVDEKAELDKIKDAYRTNAIKYHPKNDTSAEGKKKFEDLGRAYNEIISKRQTNDYGQDVSSKSLFQDFHSRMQNFQNAEVQQKGKNKVTGEKLSGQQETKVKDQKQQKDQSQKDKNNLKAEQNKDKKEDKDKAWWQKSDTKDTKDVKGGAQNKQGKSGSVSQQGKQQTKNFLKGAQLYSQSSYFEYIDGKRKLHVTKMYEKDGKTLKVDRIQDSKSDGTVQVTETLDDGNQVKHNKYIQGSSRKQRQIGF